MNKIGIIGAMQEEVKVLKEKMKIRKIIKKASMEFFEGVLEEKEVVIVISGIGKVNAAVCAQILIDDYNVEAIVNTGVAGSLRNEINIGDVVISSDALQHDMDTTVMGYEIGQIPRMEKYIFEADSRLVSLAKEVCDKENTDISAYIGRVVSGDQFISKQEKKEWLAEKFNAYCTEMEGAAISQTAYLNNIPFVIIRAISDKADNSATMDYNEFEHKAIEHTVKLVTGLLKKI